MPVIPFVQEGQRLNPSSPVPLASTESARIPGESLAGFGKALSQLGDVLDRNARKTKDAEDKTKLDLANAKLKDRLLKQKAVSMSEGMIEGDTTGFGAVEKFSSELQPFVAELADGLGDDKLKQRFLADSAQEISSANPSILANEIKKRAEANELRRSEALSLRGEMVRLVPEEFEFVRAEQELAIMDDDDIAPVDKPKRIAEANKGLLNEYVRGFTERQMWNSAKLGIDKYGGGILSTEEKTKLMTEIDQENYKYQGRRLQELDREYKEVKMQKEAEENNTVARRYLEMQQAGNDLLKRNIIAQNIMLDVAAGKLPKEKADSIVGNKVFTQVQDDLEDSKLMARVFKNPDDIDKFVEEVQRRTGVATGFSPERASDIMNRLNSIRDRAKNNPEFKRDINLGLEMLESLKQESIADPIKTLDKQKLHLDIAIAKTEYFKLVDRGVAPLDAAGRVMSNRFGQSTIIPKGRNKNYMRYGSPEALQKEKQRIFQLEVERKQKGLSTKQSQKDTRNKLRELDMIQRQMNKAPNMKEKPASAETSGAGARGK